MWYTGWCCGLCVDVIYWVVLWTVCGCDILGVVVDCVWM